MNIFTALFQRVKPTAEQTNSVYFKQLLQDAKSSNSMPDLIRFMRDYNGYVRQAAIARSVTLADAELLPEIVERLNDWVPQVRDAARSAVLTLLPLMPAQQVIGLLPAFMKLYSAGRSDHRQWLAVCERDLLKWVPIDDLVAGIESADIKVARACFDVLRRAAMMDTTALILLAFKSRRDIVMTLQAAGLIGTLAPEAQDALYHAALESHFGAVRTFALRALLRQQFGQATREIALSVLRDPQSSVRGAAIAHLLANEVVVDSYYRNLLAAASTSSTVIRICLSELAGMRNGGDVMLVKSFLANPLISIRTSAYAAWMKLAEGDKDDIAGQALADEARTIRKTALEMTRRQGAFLPFETVCVALIERQDWDLLLQFGQFEKWDGLEAIVRVALATGPSHAIRPQLASRLTTWMRLAGSYTRPRPSQAEFLRGPQATGVFESMEPKGTDFAAFLRNEIAIALGKR